MGQNILKGVIAILIIAAIVVGIYTALPAKYKHELQQFKQTTFDEGKDDIIKTYTSLKVGKSDYTYEELLKKNGADVSWVLEDVNPDAGKYRLHGYAYKVNVTLIKEDGTGDSKVYTQSPFEIIFDITYTADKKTVDSRTIYVKEELQDEYYEAEVLEAMIRNIK